MKSFFVLASITLALLLTPMTAAGQSDKTSAFGDAQVVVEINLAQFRTTELGGKIMSMAQEHAMEAIKEHHGGQPTSLEDINSFLGFNPFEEIQGAVIAIENIEAPEENLVAIIQLGSTTGNIEGLLLGLPEYESTKENGVTIHSTEFDGQKMYAAIHSKGTNKAVVIAPDKDRLVKAMEHVGDVRKMAGASSQTPFIHVSVNKLPVDMIGDGPHANIAKLVKSIELAVGEEGDQLAASLALTTDNSEHAEQIRQMADGLKAMLGFAMSADDDEDLKQVAELAKGLKVSSEDNQFNASISVPADLILKFLREEVDLPF